MANQSEDNTKLPGFGLPLCFTPSIDGRFPSVLNGEDIRDGYTGLSLTTLREFTMLHIMNQLTDKPDWNIKIFNEDIASKWKMEAMSGDDVTESMAEWVIEELKYKAKIFEQTGMVIVYNGDVVKSDIAIPTSIKDDLNTLVKPLEDVPARLKDWHPGSDGKVLDLVHPSLFPLVYGRTRVLKSGVTTLEDCIQRSGEGLVPPVPPEDEATITTRYNFNTHFHSAYSRKFQWLPCEVDISGGEAKITSYINNLHPQKHSPLYAVIEKVITRAIPLWNVSLRPNEPNLRYSRPSVRIERISYIFAAEEDIPEDEYPPREDNEDEDQYDERVQEWLSDNQRVVLPEPEKFTPPDPNVKTFDLRKAFEKNGLQIIVKLANIELTPEKPEYDGGTWHIEGQLNEHICASALYYYSSSNITPSHLAFRQQSDSEVDDISYEQDQHAWLHEVFGCEQDGPAVQDVGSVETREGRLITFPNILQHQVQPFKLADPTKSGHRKILALFLVDPYIRVISTANVPCQQRDWWREAITADGAKGIGAKVAGLPAELQDQMFERVEEFPIGLEEAKALREELMEERKEFVLGHGINFELRTFSLCEH